MSLGIMHVLCFDRNNYEDNILCVGIYDLTARRFIGSYNYRVSHLLMDLGWVDFDLGVPLTCPATQPLLPNSHHPKPNRADSGRPKIKFNPTQSTSKWDTYICCLLYLHCQISTVRKTGTF